MMAATVAAPGTTAPALQVEDLQPLLQEALRRWALAEGADLAAPLANVDVSITDLPGQELGRYVDGHILIDVDAAGHGWFIDRTPGDDREFTDDGVELVATGGLAAGRMDLLSVLEHELGHAAGFGHEAAGVMEEALAEGTRTTIEPELLADDITAGLKPQAAAPAIAWSASYGGSLLPPTPPANWQQDFVNHLARSEAQRNPNASLKLHVDLAPKLGAPHAGVQPRA
jgi:hypothetical protein